MWREAQRRTHERCWPDVVRLLAGLPPDLARQAKLVEYDLALRHSETGQFKDIFLGANHVPILSVAGWLLDDLEAGSAREREQLERHSFVASLLLAMRIHVLDRIGDDDSFYDDRHDALTSFAARRALDEMARAVPAASPFWESPEVRDLSNAEQVQMRSVGDGPDDLPGQWAAPARLLAGAVAALAGRDEVIPRLNAMLDSLAAAFQITDDLASMHGDLQQERITYPIATVAEAAGLSLHPWPAPEVVLGALALSGALPAIGEAALTRARDAHRAAADLELPTFAAYLSDAVAALEERLPSASRRAHRPGGGPVVRLSEPPLAKAVAMAEGFLGSDRSLRESWEVHREGMFGSPEVSSRFPAGLILEILCGHGHDLAGQVDEFLSFADANRFRYYDHPWSDADTDTIGVYLRLQPYATDRERQTDALDTVLGCLERQVAATGTMPVWLTGCAEPDEKRPPVLALGEGCGTVAAHLLLGLIGAGRLPAVIETGGAQLLDRIRELGLAANVDYPQRYALAIFLRLVAGLEASGMALGGRSPEVRRVLGEELEGARRAPIVGAQDAALLAIACDEAGRPDQIDPAWIARVLKRQRFDGGWEGEPFAAAPNRGWSVTWYASSTLTSALCYDALMRYARLRGA